MNDIEEIQKLKSLLDQGAITEDEYNILKKNVLAKDDNHISASIPVKTSNISENFKIENTTEPEQKKPPEVLTQNDINEFVANSDEFWSSFRQSLALPYSSFKNVSFDKWIKRISRSPSSKAHINLLFEYVMLKGEILIAFRQGFILTNCRLVIDDIKGKLSIPLSNLINYNVDNGSNIFYEKNGQHITLTYNQFIDETSVNSAKARFKKEHLNKVQLELLSKSISELIFSNPNLEIPKVDFSPSIIGVQNSIINEPLFHFQGNKPSFFRGEFIKYVIGIVIFGFFCYWANRPSSSESSNTSYPSSERSSEQEIGVFLINNTFANYEIGGTAYLKFSSQRGGGFGAMTMSMGSCDFVYSYDITGRRIQLTYTGSTCNAQGSSQTMTFNSDKTISVIIRGQSFIFRPI